MTEETRLYIENNIGLIEDCDFKSLYRSDNAPINVADFTQSLLSCGIDPLEHLDYIPRQYLAQSNITKFVVPENIRIIKSFAFLECDDLKKVVLPEGLQQIDESAFADSGLEEINFPSTITHIQDDAFGATKLKEIVLPELLQVVPMFCFEESALEKVTLGKGCRRLINGCFGACKNLHTVNLNEGLMYIDNYVFKHLPKLEKIYIPDSVVKIEDNAFWQSHPTIICIKDSVAHRFAVAQNYSFELLP